jgi:hypothetical protein
MGTVTGIGVRLHHATDYCGQGDYFVFYKLLTAPVDCQAIESLVLPNAVNDYANLCDLSSATCTVSAAA